MNRRGFIKRLLSGILGIGGLAFINSCAPLISATARDKSAGDPWQCMNCGHLTRSKEDLTGTRCPRCGKRMLTRITEEQMAEALKKLGG
jgi:DNA-directed RNA polymerase subunit RPC12/RpoP